MVGIARRANRNRVTTGAGAAPGYRSISYTSTMPTPGWAG